MLRFSILVLAVMTLASPLARATSTPPILLTPKNLAQQPKPAEKQKSGPDAGVDSRHPRIQAFVSHQEPLPPIKAGDFPSLAARVQFFEKRINATDVSIRDYVLHEAWYLNRVPDSDYVRFLKRMTRDTDPGLRGQAIKTLHEMWIPLEVRDLPETFTGFHKDQLLNPKDESLIPPLIAQCRNGGAPGGWAAYALGLLRRQESVPCLVKLGEDSNEFARYAAARALLDCGAKKDAKVILQKLMSHRFKPLAKVNEPDARPGEPDPYYVALAARAFMEIGPIEKKEGLARLVALLGELEPSKDINDINRVQATRFLLAAVTRQFFVSHAEALEWLREHGAAGK